MDAARLKAEQPALYRLLERGFREDSLPQAILLYSSPRCAFRDLVHFIAQSLTCASGSFACGTCPQCHRFLDGHRPDYVEIDGGDGNITKDQIAALRDFFAQSAVQNGIKHRAYAIIDCQSMNDRAANALLKFLEEPTPGITAILTAPALESVIPTIISRCETIRINPRSRQEIYYSIADAVGQDAAYFLSDYSGDEQRLLDTAELDDFKLAGELAAEFIRSLDRGLEPASFALLEAARRGSGKPRCYNFFYGDVSRFLSDALAQDGLFGPFAPQIERFGREQPDLAARMELSLRESQSKAKANLSFAGVLARLAKLLIG